MMKTQHVAMRLHSGCGKYNYGIETKLKLPEGCTGLLLCFKSKKAARDFFGKDTPTMEIYVSPDKK